VRTQPADRSLDGAGRTLLSFRIGPISFRSNVVSKVRSEVNFRYEIKNQIYLYKFRPYSYIEKAIIVNQPSCRQGFLIAPADDFFAIQSDEYMGVDIGHPAVAGPTRAAGCVEQSRSEPGQKRHSSTQKPPRSWRTSRIQSLSNTGTCPIRDSGRSADDAQSRMRTAYSLARPPLPAAPATSPPSLPVVRRMSETVLCSSQSPAVVTVTGSGVHADD
jgi:hypothetical protein